MVPGSEIRLVALALPEARRAPATAVLGVSEARHLSAKLAEPGAINPRIVLGGRVLRRPRCSASPWQRPADPCLSRQ